ncbi:MAG: sensor histidine kinase [Pseudomonadota bacterium]
MSTHLAPPDIDAMASTDMVAEANHRIANSLTLLVSMVRMQAVSVKKKQEALSNADVRMLLDGIAARINTISQLHRILSRTGADGVVSLKPHLEEVTSALVAALSSPDQQVKVMHTGSDCMVPMRHVQPIVLILCEAFINAMKYAHPANVPLIMTVDCNVSADGRLVFTISDDGVGLPDGFDSDKSGGLGFRVMRSLAAEIGGVLQIQSTHLGLTFRVALPTGALASIN